MAGAIPDIVIRLTGDVDQFIRAWNEAARAAEQAAARIRAAGAAAGNGPDVDSSRFRDLNAELERMTRAARAAADAIRDHGNASRRAGDDADSLGRRLRELETRLGGLGGGFRSAGGGGQFMAIAIGVLGSILPAIVAGIFALGAALTGIVMAAGVAALGARGLGQAFDRLQATIKPLQAQLDSLFRVQLGNEFAKLGQAITSQLTPAFKDVARAISDVIKGVSEWIRSAEGMSTIKTALAGVRDLIRALEPAVKGVVQIFVEFAAAAAPSMQKIGQAISEVVVGIRDMFREAQKSGQLKQIFDAGAEAIKGFGEIIKGVIKILMEMASQGGEPAAEALKKFGRALQEAAPAIGAFFAAAARIADVVATVVEWIAKAVGWFSKLEVGGKKLGDVLMAALNPFSLLIANIKMIGDLFPKAGKEIDKFVSTVQKGMDKVAQDIAKGVAKAGQEITKWATKMVMDAKAGIDKFTQAVKQWWTKTTADIKQGVNQAAQAVKQWADKTVADIKSFTDRAVQAVKEWWDKTVSDVKSGVDRAVAAVKELADKAVDAIKELPSKFEQAGKDMVAGLVKGLLSGATNLVKSLVDMVMKAVAAAKAALNIHSPSRLLDEEVGQMIPAGITQGIVRGTPGMVSAMQRAVRQLPVAANVALSGAGGIRGAALSGGGRQVVEVKLAVGSGGDGAMGTAIAKLARSGQLKLTANAVVGGRR